MPSVSFETEKVREFEPHETAAAPDTATSGYAPAAPIANEWPSDLQQVESDPEKVRVAQQAPDAPEQQARPKRVRQSPPPVSDEPLVQIETSRSDGGSQQSEERKATEGALPG